jgi:hypothetical protein
VTSVVSNWRNEPPYSIVSKDKTMHLSVVELRVEDYFLIRTGKLQEKHASQIQKNMREGSFNEGIINTSLRLLPFSSERPLDLV